MQRRKRVCFPFVGDSVGGSQVSAAMLITALDQERYRPLVVLHEDGPLAGYLERRDIAYEVLPLRAYVGAGRRIVQHVAAALRTLPPTRRFLRERNVDIVHAQDGRMNQTWGPAARSAGTNFVWHQRSMYAPSRLTRLALRCADAVVCNSDFVRQGLPADVRAAAVVLVNPFDTATAPPNRDLARADCLRAIGADGNVRLVGFVGNLTRQKRPDIFLEAATDIHARLPQPTCFLLFGRDREGAMPALRQMADQSGLTGAVHFMGFRDPIQPWIAGCDLLLAPEVNDAFGRALVEAMLVGTPVITSRSGGHVEVIDEGETGLLVPADDSAALSGAAVRVLSDDDLAQRLAAAGQSTARDRYSVTAHAGATMSLYDQLHARH